jgi:hypothetical protein
VTIAERSRVILFRYFSNHVSVYGVTHRSEVAYFEHWFESMINSTHGYAQAKPKLQYETTGVRIIWEGGL